MAKREVANRIARLGRSFCARPASTIGENAARPGETVPDLREYYGPTTPADVCFSRLDHASLLTFLMSPSP